MPPPPLPLFCVPPCYAAIPHYPLRFRVRVRVRVRIRMRVRVSVKVGGIAVQRFAHMNSLPLL